MLSDSWQQFYDQSQASPGDKSADWYWLQNRFNLGRHAYGGYGGDWDGDARIRELLLAQARDKQTLNNAAAEFAKLSPKQKVGMEISTLSSLGAYDSGKYGDVSDRYMATQEEIRRLEFQRAAWLRNQPSAAPQPARPQPQQAAPAPQQPPSPAPAPPVPAAQQPAQPQAAAPQQATAYAPPRPQTAAGQAPMKLPKQGQAQPIPPRTQGTQMVAPPKPAGQGSIPWMNSQAQPAPQRPGPFLGGDAMPYGQPWPGRPQSPQPAPQPAPQQPGPFMGGDAMPYGQAWPGRAQQQHMPAPQPQYQQQMAMPAQPAPMEDAGGAWQVDERRKSAYHQQLLDRIAELEAPRPNQNNPWRTDNQKIKRAGLAAEHNAAAWDRQQAWEAEDRAKTLKRLQQIREQHYGHQAPSSQGAASGISAPRFAG